MAIDLITQYQSLVDEKFTTESKKALLPTMTIHGQAHIPLRCTR